MVKVNLKSIKRLVIFGCSYTAGCELLDHTLEEGFGDLKKSIDIWSWFLEIHKNERIFQQLLNNREKEKYLAWPGKLSNNLNLEILSYAFCGNSNERMLWEIEDKIYRNIISDTDLILVGITSPFRSMNFDNSSEEPIPFLLTDQDYIKKNFSEHIHNYFNDSRIVWNYIRDLEHFLHLKKRLNNRLFLVFMERPGFLDQNLYWNLDDLGKQYDFFKFKVKQLTESDLFLSSKEFLLNDCGEMDVLPHRHPKEEIHQQFANTLSKYFQKSANN